MSNQLGLYLFVCNQWGFGFNYVALLAKDEKAAFARLEELYPDQEKQWGRVDRRRLEDSAVIATEGSYVEGRFDE